MKLKALTDIKLNKNHIAIGSEFEATESQAEFLFSLGWAEAVEEVKAPKEAPKKASKKTAKK